MTETATNAKVLMDFANNKDSQKQQRHPDDVRQRHIGVEFQVDESNRWPMPFWVWIYFQLEIRRSGSREIDLKRKSIFDEKSSSKIFSIEIFYWL